MSRLSIRTHEKRFPVAPDLYGLFFEDISHAGDGGLYPEMLRNRSFEDSLMPEGCVSHDGGKTFVSPTGWIDEFNNGEGMNQWVADNRVQPTPVPAWYCEGAEMTLDSGCVLNAADASATSDTAELRRRKEKNTVSIRLHGQRKRFPCPSASGKRNAFFPPRK